MQMREVEREAEQFTHASFIPPASTLSGLEQEARDLGI